MLHANLPCEERVPGVGDVAGSEDAGQARREHLVDHDSVLDRRPCGLRKADSRNDANTDDDEIARDRLVIARPDALHCALAFKRVDACPGAQLDSVASVNVTVEPAELLPKDALQRHGRWFDDRHVKSALTRRRGELRTDPAGTDHDDLAAGLKPRS